MGCKVQTRQDLLWSLTAATGCPGSGDADKARPGACWCRCRCRRPRPPEDCGLSSPTPCRGSNHLPFGGGGLCGRWGLRSRGSRRRVNSAKGRDAATRGDTALGEAGATQAGPRSREPLL